jgi:alkanesulfonate monooxygenase SsuD/methylene tetrahydromethanopterin reductase-like flavin-dependent oxidoreductase (luciferase family)
VIPVSLKEALYPDTADVEDFGYERIQRLLRMVRGEPVTGFSIESFSDRVQPHSPGPAERLWYGGASLRSAQWAGEQGILLTSSVVTAEECEDFAEVQLSRCARSGSITRSVRRPGSPRGWSSSASDTATAEQRAKYEAYAASRLGPALGWSPGR